MSFTRINPNRITDDEQFLFYPVDAATDADNIPIFLIPGILGGGDIGSIANALAEINPDRPIYLWEDPGLQAWNNATNFKSLESQARKIGHDIMQIHGSSKIPPVLVGFSSGCAITALTAKLFNANGVTPFTYIIDGATRAQTLVNFTTKDKKPLVLKDLILIIETIAKRAGVDNPPRLPAEIISIVNNIMQVEERAKKYSELLCDLIKKEMPLEDFFAFKQAFDQQFRVVHRNLRNMRLTPDAKVAQKIQQPLPYLTLFLTQELMNKHPGTLLAGWEQEAEKLTFIHNDAIRQATHLALVTDQALIDVIAHAILNQLKNNAKAINTYIASQMLVNTKKTFIQQFANDSENLPKRVIIDLSSSPSLSDDEKYEEEQENRQANLLLSSSPTSSDEQNSLKRSISPSALFQPKPPSPPISRRNAEEKHAFMRASC